MCLAFIVNQVIDGLPVLLLFNRDEDYERVSLPAHYWADAPHILGGFDASSGGTWAGVRKDGRFGMLTFVREPRLPITPTLRRGQIVRNFLLGEKSVNEFVAELEADPGAYLGYNVILGEPGTVVHYNNRSQQRNVLGRGVYGVSNADLETPWFKVTRGKAAIDRLLAARDIRSESLFNLLEDRTVAPDGEVQVTGLNPEREKAKSPLFVTLPDYGTRSTSVVRLYESGAVHFDEKSFGRDGRLRLVTCLNADQGW